MGRCGDVDCSIVGLAAVVTVGHICRCFRLSPLVDDVHNALGDYANHEYANVQCETRPKMVHRSLALGIH